MREPTARRVNRAGRAVWFVRSTDDSSTVRPVAREGVIAFVLALLLVLGGGGAMMLGVLLTQSMWWIPATFAAVAAGMVTFAVVVSRHLP